MAARNESNNEHVTSTFWVEESAMQVMRARRQSPRGGIRRRAALAAAVTVLAALAAPATALAQVPPLPVPPLPIPVPLPGVGTPTVAEDLTHEVVTTAVTDPIAVEAAPDGRILIGERTGTVKILSPDGTIAAAGRIGVDARSNQCTDCPGKTVDEGGLHGLLVARDFAATGHLYAYYSVPNSQGVAPRPAKWPGAGGSQAIEGLFRLSRFTMTGNTLDPDSEVAILENPAEWLECCHYGGDMEWLPDGTLLLSVGDDTNPHASSGYSPRDTREGREAWNADRSAQNPADRRGKLLRLMPDGSVPTADKGVSANPHVDDPAYDPYVYAMGFRSNYRIAVDQATGFTFVGNVGPDASTPNPQRGPAGYDEFETVPPGGGTNHGWPRCIGNNIPYNDYDFATQQAGSALSCEDMTPADIYYTPAVSTTWPELGSGSRTAIAGVVYDHPGDGARRLPGRLDRTLLLLEYSRNRLWSVALQDDGRMNTSQLTTEAQGLRKPIDAAIGADGALYLAEYGSGFYNNTTSRITRISGAGAGTAGDSEAPASSGPGRAPAGAVLGLGALLAGAAVRRRRGIV